MKKIFSMLLILTMLLFAGCSNNYEIVDKDNNTIDKTTIEKEVPKEIVKEEEIKEVIEEKNPEEGIDKTIQEEKEEPKTTQSTFQTMRYTYDNKPYNIHLRTSQETLKNEEIKTEVKLEEIIDSTDLTMLFQEVNGIDNSKLAKGSTFLTSFLSGVHDMKFVDFRTVENDKLNCDESTLEHKYILFKPYSNREGIFYNEVNGCMIIETKKADRLIFLTEKFVYDIITS